MLLDRSTHNGGLRQNGSSSNSSSNVSTSGVASVRVAVLGANGVGKTSLIEQFTFNHFSATHKATRHRHMYYPSVLLNEHAYLLQIVDMPCLPAFPPDSLSEWMEARGGLGLHGAAAYLLVFDVTSEESFRYVRRMRTQILESASADIPIVVVANKCDLSEEIQMPRKDLAAMVKKQWRCVFLETSAKHNWHVTLAFRELLRVIDSGEVQHKPAAARMQDALRRNSCVIL